MREDRFWKQAKFRMARHSLGTLPAPIQTDSNLLCLVHRSLGALRDSLPDYWRIRIGILPKSEEVLIDGGRTRAIPRSEQRPGQLETRHWSDWIVQHKSRMIENFTKLSCGLARAAQPRISETTHVDRIERSEEGSAGKVCGAGNGEVVGCGGVRNFERFRRVILVECFERPQHRQVTELDRRILRVTRFEVRCDLLGLRGIAQKRKSKGRSIVGIPASAKRQRRRRASLCLRPVPEQRIPHRRSPLKHGGPPRQTSLASQAYCARR